LIDSLFGYSILAFGSLFAVLNPFATVPPFMAMTADNSAEERKVMARRAVLLAFSVLTVFAISGLRVLNFFGVSVEAFQIAGGLVLVRVAFDLLQGGSRKVTPEEHLEGAEKDDISITPLAVPILCGPATITAVILLSSQAATWIDLLVLVATMGVIYAGIFVMLRFVADHSHWLGDTPTRVTARLMGLILVAVAVQFVLQGIRQAIAS
jgi:multiple antibiotic resistance protein